MPVWCQDEGGPYQAIPQPSPAWQPQGCPARRPHEYGHGGTIKLLTLFRPATGELRGEPVERTPNAILHPWLQRALSAILAQGPPAPDAPSPGRRWVDWRYQPGAEGLDRHRPPLRWLRDALSGWNRHPTAFTWGGKRHARRDRAYARRHRLGGSGATTLTPLTRRLRTVRHYHAPSSIAS